MHIIKSSALILGAMFIFLGSIAQALSAFPSQIQQPVASKDVKYGWAYAYSYKDKVMYISNLFTVPGNEYWVGVENQWHSKFKVMRGRDYTEFTIDVGMGLSRGEADSSRDDWISDFKNKDFEIKNVSFYYRPD